MIHSLLSVWYKLYRIMEVTLEIKIILCDKTIHQSLADSGRFSTHDYLVDTHDYESGFLRWFSYKWIRLRIANCNRTKPQRLSRRWSAPANVFSCFNFHQFDFLFCFQTIEFLIVSLLIRDWFLVSSYCSASQLIGFN